MTRLLLLLVTALLISCATPVPTHTAQLNSGFGGTGWLPCPQAPAAQPGDSGFGGTGHEDTCGFGGTGVVGTITDFGSIWVNGLEIELKPDTRIDSNLGHPVQLAIGQQVITHTAATALETDHVQVFYPIAGRIQQQQTRLISVAGQRIRLDDNTRGLKALRTGQYVAINAFPQPDGTWLATRIDPNPARIERLSHPNLSALKTQRALVEGTVLKQGDRHILAPYGLPLSAEQVRSLKQGTLALAVARRLADGRWHIQQVRALHQWQMDWQAIMREQRETRLERHAVPTTHLIREQHENAAEMRTLHNNRENMESLHEANESLQEQREALHEMRETDENLREASESLREQRESLYEMRETDENLREIQESTQDMRPEWDD